MNLQRELDQWVAEDLVSAEQADAIRSRYRDTETSRRRDRVVKALGIVGATVVGFGVILFFAANWDGIPRDDATRAARRGARRKLRRGVLPA